MASFKRSLRRMLWSLGWDVSRFDPATHFIARRRHLMTTYEIDLVLDVGANAGQFARSMREDVAYAGRMISFEPVREAFDRLAVASRGDPLWRAQNYGLGEANENLEINVAGNSFSSSILPMLPEHLRTAPESQYVRTEKIAIRTLDSVEDEWLAAAKNVYLKIDTQGYEKNVLRGARKRLRDIGTIQLEMSLVPLYQGEDLFPQMHQLLDTLGYRMVAVEPGFMNAATGELLQLDGIFRRIRS